MSNKVFSQVVLPQELPQQIEYPCLARNLRNDVVLFTSQNTGVVVVSGDVSQEVGHFSNEWLSLETSGRWEVLPKGTVVTISIS